MCSIEIRVEIAYLCLVLFVGQYLKYSVSQKIYFKGCVSIGRRSYWKRVLKKQELLNHFIQEEHFVFVLGLDNGDGYRNCKCYYACYRLLDREVHNLKISDDFFKTSKRFRQLVCVYKPKDIVKMSKSGSRCSCFFLRTLRREGFFSSIAAT